jgi:hypothetical protein
MAGSDDHDHGQRDNRRERKRQHHDEGDIVA